MGKVKNNSLISKIKQSKRYSAVYLKNKYGIFILYNNNIINLIKNLVWGGSYRSLMYIRG